MADTDSDHSDSSPPLPSTSRDNISRNLSPTSRSRSGSPSPRPSSSRGFNHRGWSSSSRGVTPRFRNFCITNEHPDGVVFWEPDGSHASNKTSTNQVQEEEIIILSPPPAPRTPSPSVDSSSPTVSFCLVGEEEDLSDNGTIVLSSGGSENEEDHELDKVESASGLKTSNSGEVDKAQTQEKSDNEMPVDDNVVQPPPEVGHAAVVAVEDNEVPEYLHHKKFHYKQVQAAAAARSRELNVDNLRLSAYITQEQAAIRLQALGDLQETQKEIDDFAAIICASNMYRLNLARGDAAGGSTIGRGRPTRMSITSTGSGIQLPAIVELQEGNKLASTTSVAAGVAARGHESSTGGGAMASTSTAAISQTAAAVTSEMDVCTGDRKDNNDSYPVTGMTSGKASYFQATSPGHASSTDDYEWISDADD